MDPWAILNQTTQKSFNTVDDYQNAAEKKNRIDAGDQANQENAMKLQEMQKQQQASQIMNDVLKSHSNPTSDGVTPTVHPPAGQQVPQTVTAQNGQAFPTGAPIIPPSTQQAPNNGTFGPSTLDSTIANMKQISSAVMNPQPQPTQTPQAPPSQAATPQSPQVPIPTQLTHEPLPSQKDDQNAQFITPAGTPSYAARQAMAQRLTQAGLGDQIPTIVNHWQAQDLQARKVEMEKHTQDITFVDSLLQGVKTQPNEQMKSVAWSQALAKARNAGMDVSALPASYDAKTCDPLIDEYDKGLLTAKERVELNQKDIDRQINQVQRDKENQFKNRQITNQEKATEADINAPMSSEGRIMGDDNLSPAEKKAAIANLHYHAPNPAMANMGQNFDPSQSLPNTALEMRAIRVAQSGQPEQISSRNPMAGQVNGRAMQLSANPQLMQSALQASGLTGGGTLTAQHQQVAAQAKGIQSFAPGGVNGQNVTALNTAGYHLNQLEGMADALQNGDMQKANQFKNWAKTMTGSPDVTNFRAIAHAAGTEVAKVLKGGGVLDQESSAQVQKDFDAANSPAQLKGVLDQYRHLVKGRFDALNQAYSGVSPTRSTLGQDGRVSPDAIKFMSKGQTQSQEQPQQVNPPVVMRNGKQYTLHSDGNYYLGGQ